MYLLSAILVLGCLAVNARVAPRIIGGHDAPNHKYPYQVSLQVSQSSGSHFCSGSILNERWVLTAAHCVYTKLPHEVKIVAGTNFLGNETGEVYRAERIVVNEDYIHFYHNDIALIKTSAEIVFSDIVKPVGLPVEDISDYSNVVANFSGWGVTDLSSLFPPHNLQEIELKIVSVEECHDKLSEEITANHICTYNKIAEGICFGDSGGPLVVNGSQVGIASFVRPCADGYPDAYTRVYSYTKWVNEHIKE